MSTIHYESDIPQSVAIAAHSGTSFVPEQRAERERKSYAAQLTADYDALAKLATTDEKRAILESEFARYREGYKARTLAYLQARSRMVSWMIAGRSNFPVSQQEKIGSTADKRLKELCEYRERALEAIRRTLRPELRPIMSGDADAVERLQEKIAAAEKVQEIMKASNAAIRKHWKQGREATIAALVALGHPESRAVKLLEPDCFGGQGFPDFEIRNNAAEIRRLKKRLASISHAKAQEVADAEGEHARLEDCPAENRVRLYYPGKPAAEVRDNLKRHGFRWAPSMGCWQAYRNHRSIEAAKRLAGLQPSCSEEV